MSSKKKALYLCLRHKIAEKHVLCEEIILE